MAGITAMLEIDIKKVIALSTLRQLGVIMITLGELEPILSFFHLLRHAYFKAILFICAGIIIHNIKDYQDIRKIRIILNILPITFRVIIVANLRLCGLPFLRGFYSKDIILEVIIISTISLIIFVIILVANFFISIFNCRRYKYYMINFFISSYYFSSCLVKNFCIILIFIAVIRGLIRLKTNKSNNFFIKFFVGLI